MPHSRMDTVGVAVGSVRGVSPATPEALFSAVDATAVIDASISQAITQLVSVRRRILAEDPSGHDELIALARPSEDTLSRLRSLRERVLADGFRRRELEMAIKESTSEIGSSVRHS